MTRCSSGERCSLPILPPQPLDAEPVTLKLYFGDCLQMVDDDFFVADGQQSHGVVLGEWVEFSAGGFDLSEDDCDRLGHNRMMVMADIVRPNQRE